MFDYHERLKIFRQSMDECVRDWVRRERATPAQAAKAFNIGLLEVKRILAGTE